MINILSYIIIFTELLCIGFFSLYKYNFYNHRRKDDLQFFVIMMLIAFSYLIGGITLFDFNLTSVITFKHIFNIGVIVYLAYLFFSRVYKEVQLKNTGCI